MKVDPGPHTVEVPLAYSIDEGLDINHHSWRHTSQPCKKALLVLNFAQASRHNKTREKHVKKRSR